MGNQTTVLLFWCVCMCDGGGKNSTRHFKIILSQLEIMIFCLSSCHHRASKRVSEKKKGDNDDEQQKRMNAYCLIFRRVIANAKSSCFHFKKSKHHNDESERAVEKYHI
jgi:hypothetical protein